jgi:hypothetical protein
VHQSSENCRNSLVRADALLTPVARTCSWAGMLFESQSCGTPTRLTAMP